jgi:hypothetical protein
MKKATFEYKPYVPASGDSGSQKPRTRETNKIISDIRT